MPPKRKAESEPTAPPAPKRIHRKRPAIITADAPMANNQALLKLADGMSLPAVVDFLQSIPEPKDFGGFGPFNADAFKESMKVGKEYTCLMKASALDPLKTTHSQLVPSYGSLQSKP
jgi:hypothetical protein